MKKLIKYAMLMTAQAVAALALAVYWIGPAIRGEPFPFQPNAETEQESVENEEDAASDEAEEARHTKKEKRKSRKQGALVPIESVIVNVAETQGRRFLKASLTLEMDEGEVADVQPRVPVLRGAVIDVLAARNLDDLVAPNARGVIREEILETLNSKDEDLQFKDLYFTEFIVQ
jgi:flagellar FliL protein